MRTAHHLTRRGAWLVLLAATMVWLARCGYERVELADPLGDEANVLVDGAIAKRVIDAFTRGKAKRVGMKELAFTHPPERAFIPVGSAPLSFSWSSELSMGGREKPGPRGEMAAPEPPEAQQADPKEAYVFELSVEGDAGKVRLYTEQTSGVLTQALWDALLASQVDRKLTVRLRAVRTSRLDQVFEGPTLTLEVRPAWPAGTLYFGVDGVVHRQTVGRPALEPITLPDCTDVFAVSGLDRRIALRCLDQTLRILTLPEGKLVSTLATQASAEPLFALDPTGLRLVSAEGGELQLFDVESGAMRAELALAGANLTSAPSWSPDGSALVFTTLEGASEAGPRKGSSLLLTRVDARGELSAPQILERSEGPEGLLREPRFSPDGSYLAYLAGAAREPSAGGTIRLLPVQGGPAFSLAAPRAQPQASIQHFTWVPSGRAGAYWLLFSARVMAEPAARLQLWLSWLEPAQKQKAGMLELSPPILLPARGPAYEHDHPVWASGEGPPGE